MNKPNIPTMLRARFTTPLGVGRTLLGPPGGPDKVRPTRVVLRRTLRNACVFLVALAAPAAAQDEAALRSALEGRHVTLRIDMPATSDGVDVKADARQPLDYRQHGDRLKRYGTSLRSGESVMVTLVKLKKDLIEFQLNGGGFGTFGDDTSTSVYIPHMEKSTREKDLEKRVKDETDPRRKRQLQDELDDVRERR